MDMEIDVVRVDKNKVRRQMRRARIRRFAELARRINITPQALSRWFRGRPFSSVSLGLLIAVLDCTPNDVLEWDDREQ